MSFYLLSATILFSYLLLAGAILDQLSVDILLNSELNKNIAISPLSLRSSLLPLLRGAGGETKIELEKFLGETKDIKTAVSTDGKRAGFDTKTRLFFAADVRLLPQYKDDILEEKQADFKQIDFTRDAELVNEWVRNGTGGLVDGIVKPGPDTRLLVVNTVRFKGKWAQAPNLKGRATFNGNSRPTQVDFLSFKGLFNYSKSDFGELIEIDYEDEAKLRILLPKLPGDHGLRRALQAKNFRLKATEVFLKLPKFKILSEPTLVPILQKAGLTTLFSAQANLSLISDEELRVGSLVQKTYVSIDKYGTEAGSATGVYIVPLAGFQPVQLAIDRPFIFLIVAPRSRTRGSNSSDSPADEVLFSGIVSDIEESSPEEVGERPLATGPEKPWWIHSGPPQYLREGTRREGGAEILVDSARFQQPEPVDKDGIRFLKTKTNGVGQREGS